MTQVSASAEDTVQTSSPSIRAITDSKAGDLQQTGKELRKAINGEYRRLVQNHQLTLNSSIDDVVGKFIPIGMSFHDAEIVLQGANFDYKISDKMSGSPQLIATTKIGETFVETTEVVIGLTPSTPNNFDSNIEKRFAIISHTSL